MDFARLLCKALRACSTPGPKPGRAGLAPCRIKSSCSPYQNFFLERFIISAFRYSLYAAIFFQIISLGEWWAVEVPPSQNYCSEIFDTLQALHVKLDLATATVKQIYSALFESVHIRPAKNLKTSSNGIFMEPNLL